MVHGELIRAGQVEKLTYRQVRSLEKIDAKKARETKLLELFERAIEAGGRIGQGLFQGTITGPIALVLLLTSTYPAWLPPVEAAAQALTGAIADGWKVTGGSAAPPPPPLNNIDGGEGNYGVSWEPQLWVTVIESIGGIPTAGGTQWYQTSQEQNAAYNSDAGDSGKNWYWSFSKVYRNGASASSSSNAPTSTTQINPIIGQAFRHNS